MALAVLTGDHINEVFFYIYIYKCTAVLPGRKKVALITM